MSNTADKVIAIAEAEVGYLEKSKTAYLADPSVLNDKTKGAGSDNYTKYGKEMHDIYPTVMDFPAAWCDCFVDWCFQKAYGVSNAKGLLRGDFNDYTVGSKSLYVAKSAYYKTPKAGDQIFFTNGTRVYHTGLVYKVDATKVYTIEGNSGGGNTVIENGGGVVKKSYLLTYAKIDGYGRPKYDESTTTTTTTTTTKKNGWAKEGTKWYYYKDGVKLKKEWIHYNHHWYRLGNNGEMLVGWHNVPDKDGKAYPCYFDETEENLGAEWHERSNGFLEVWTTKD